MAAGKNKQLIHQEVKQYISLLQELNIVVIQAYIFGSYAKNRADDWSDIDLAIVTDNFIGDSFDFRFMLSKLARKIDPDIEPHPYLASDFNDANPFAAEIIRDGEQIV